MVCARPHPRPVQRQRMASERRPTTAVYRRLSPSARYHRLAVSGEVNRMIASAINANPQWFWRGPDA
jgi:hypothetical protein